MSNEPDSWRQEGSEFGGGEVMATITVNEKYRIQSDSRQWILQRAHSDKKTGETSWTGFEYYSNIENAMKGLAERMLRESDASGMQDIHAEAVRISEIMREACAVPEVGR